MRRRAFLAALGAGAGAGCVGGSDGSDSSAATTRTTDDTTSGAADEADADGTASDAGWRMDGHGAGRTGYNSTARLPTDASVAWRDSVGEDATSTTAPVTDDRRVYVGYTAQRATVIAYGASGGGRAWRVGLGRDRERLSGLAVADGSVYVGTRVDRADESRLVSLSAADGARRWQATLPATLTGPPVVADGRLYAATGEDDSAVYAYELDGTRSWRRAIDGEAYTAVCFDAGVVFVGTATGDVAALSAEDGERLWTAEVAAGKGCCPDIQGTPAVADGRLYVPGVGYRLYAVATDDGSVEWTTELLEGDYGNPVPSPAVADGTVYVNTVHGGLIAIDAADGSERWRTDGQSGYLPPAAAGDGVVCPRTDASVAAYDRAGERTWQFEMKRPDAPGETLHIVDPEVAVAHDRVYVTIHDGRVYAIGPA